MKWVLEISLEIPTLVRGKKQVKRERGAESTQSRLSGNLIWLSTKAGLKTNDVSLPRAIGIVLKCVFHLYLAMLSLSNTCISTSDFTAIDRIQ